MNLDAVEQYAGLAESESSLFAPGLAEWQPELSGEMDLVIDDNGRWFHEGTEIKRARLVNLFTRILRREGDDYFLLTPVEKWRIKVMSYPLWVSLLEDVQGKCLLTLSCGYQLALDQNSRPRLEADSVVVDVAPNMCAKLHRNAYYDFVERLREDDQGYFLEIGDERLRVDG
ncbi:DUF1285 domain-containing protein [Umboniibacter marinipuniceus]|uniref:DUF1285 domain-containing protein n=1 Tax=Umboniibacter marinipuniceus TaxID=569599 RepID=A0A3M0AQ21_9GAMM|nr:DUF1285 domain-containing protein [Umboniibacter marinipuniceus]RMA81102.1 hypothetical protein DFR27_0896 [Umboniibacter marinipuniceus]